MNFTPFAGVPLSAALPVTHFTQGKVTQGVATANGQVVGVLQGGENGVHYIRPLDPSVFAASSSPTHSNGQQAQIITLPITMPGAKPGDPQQTVQIQVVNPIQATVSMAETSPSQSPKYQLSSIPVQTFGQGATVLTVAYNPNQEGIQLPIMMDPPSPPVQDTHRTLTLHPHQFMINSEQSRHLPRGQLLQGQLVFQNVDGQNATLPEGMTVVAALQPQDIQLIQQHADNDKSEKELVATPVAIIKNENAKDDSNNSEASSSVATANYIQNSAVQEYLQRIQNTTLPLSLQQFLKFNTDSVIKRERITEDGVIETIVETNDGDQEHEGTLIMHGFEIENEESVDDPEKAKRKKRYKKKPPKPKKPKPGQVHIATALDGTTLFCCPECHMAYPEKELLEQHLVGHKIERRFICDICGAGLKRKEHLERHKLGHNPERPFVCSICMKGFKRKEHLNLHVVIHSGEKTEICGECGKGFYRKDHLRKHARSHITRRAKEQQQQNQALINKDATTQVTIQVPTSQLQIPVQIQVPQHHIQVSAGNDEENNQVSTVVLPAATEGMTIQVPQHHIQVSAGNDNENNHVSTVVLPTATEGMTIQVPQHHIQISTGNDDEDNQVSTVVLPGSSESMTILPQ